MLYKASEQGATFMIPLIFIAFATYTFLWNSYFAHKVQQKQFAAETIRPSISTFTDDDIPQLNSPSVIRSGKSFGPDEFATAWSANGLMPLLGTP